MLAARRFPFLSASKRRKCVSGPCQVAIFRPPAPPWSAPRGMQLKGARPPLYSLVRRRSGYPLRWVGVVPVRAWFLVVVCCLCALVCWRRWGHTVRRWSLAVVRWPRSVEGAVCLRRPVAVGALVAAVKWRNLPSSGRLGGSRCAFCCSLALFGASGEEPLHRTRARRGALAPL